MSRVNLIPIEKKESKWSKSTVGQELSDHCSGTEAAFFEEPNVLRVSRHFEAPKSGVLMIGQETSALLDI